MGHGDVRCAQDGLQTSFTLVLVIVALYVFSDNRVDMGHCLRVL